ncbi:hypothetical protein BDR26DRAFT_329929 [Obelidium mucronatum]|nr:hypothetical protein BDR26DRAFT_329929 [Obelidium mucronatum]
MSKKITTGNWNVTNVLLAGLGMIACYGIVRLEISMSLSNIPLFSGITGFLVAYFSQVAGSRCNIVETSLVFVKSYIAIFIGFFSFHSLTSSLLLSLSYAVEAMAVWGLLAKAMGFTNVQDLSIMTVLASPFLIIAVPSTIASFCRYFIIENAGGGGYDSLLSPSQAMLLSWSADVTGLILLAPTILISFKKYKDYAPAITSKTIWILLSTTVASAIVPTSLNFLNAGFDSHLYTVFASLIISSPAVLYGGIIGLSLANVTSLVLALCFLFLKPSSNYYVTLSTTLHTHDNDLILLYFYCIIQITGMVLLWVSLDGKFKLQAEKTACQDLITMRIQELKKENSEQEIRQIQYMRAICNKYMDVSGSPATQDSTNEMFPNRCASDILEYLLYLELKSKKLAIQSVATDLEDLLSTRIEEIYNMYKERGIKFKHEFNTMFDWIRVDPVRIEQVVLNVLMGPMQV